MATEKEKTVLAINLQLAWRAWIKGNRIETEARKTPIEKPDLEFMLLADAFVETHRANSKMTINTVTRMLGAVE